MVVPIEGLKQALDVLVLDYRVQKRSLQVDQGSLRYVRRLLSCCGGFDGGGDGIPRITSLPKTNYDKARGRKEQTGRRSEQELRIARKVASEFDELPVGPLMGVFAGEFVLGLFFWKNLYDERETLASELLLVVLLWDSVGWLTL